MLVIKKNKYEKVVHGMKLPLKSKENCIDVHHKNNSASSYELFDLYE